MDRVQKDICTGDKLNVGVQFDVVKINMGGGRNTRKARDPRGKNILTRGVYKTKFRD